MTPQEAYHRILAVDVGTMGARAMLFDLTGAARGMAYREYRSHVIAPGVVEHDPQTWLDAVDAVIPEVLGETGTSGDAVRVLSVTAQRATIVPVDAGGTPLAHAIHWQDKRTRDQCREIEAVMGMADIHRRTGLRIDPYFSLPKLMWLRQERPDVFRAAHRFLTVHDLVVHSLTGEFITDWTQASRTMLLRIDRFEWDSEIAETFGVDLDRLPRLLPPGSVAGEVSQKAAERLGIQPGTPVVAAGGDQQCAALGLGVVQPGQVKVTTGTGSFVVAPAAGPRYDPQARILCSASAVAGSWVLEAGVFTAGSVLRWWRDALGPAASSPTAYDELMSEAARSGPGAGGILVIPHYAGSASPYWDPDARGVIFNLHMGQKRADLLRAVMEGVALEVNKNLRIMSGLIGAGEGGTALKEVRVSGGAVRSDLFNQVQADIYGLRVVPGGQEQASALGAAILGSVAVGAYPTVEAACAAMSSVDPDRIREPDPRRHDFYQVLGDLHHAVFLALSRAELFRLTAAMEEQLPGARSSEET